MDPGSTSPFGTTTPYVQPGLNELSLSVVLDQHPATHLAAAGSPVYDERPASPQENVDSDASRLEEVDNGILPSTKRHIDMPKTLPWVLVDFLRGKETKAATEAEMCGEVSKVYTDLRKPDGAKYTGNLQRAVRGSLCSTGFFEKTDNNCWALKEENARLYEQRLVERYTRLDEKRARKRKEKIKSQGSNSPSGGVQPKRPHARKVSTSTRLKRGARKEMVLRMIAGINERLKKHESWKECCQNPLRNFKGTESDDDVWKRLGNDKFLFMLQMYNYFADILEHRAFLAGETSPITIPLKTKSNADAAGNFRGRKKTIKQLPSDTETLTNDSVKGLTMSIAKLQDTVAKLQERLSHFPVPQSSVRLPK